MQKKQNYANKGGEKTPKKTDLKGEKMISRNKYRLLFQQSGSSAKNEGLTVPLLKVVVQEKKVPRRSF